MKPGVDVYRRLQRHLDNMPVPFPATMSGVELRLLRHFFSPDEAEVALALSAAPEPVSTIARRLRREGSSAEDLEKTLDTLVARGSISGGRRKGRAGVVKVYGKAPLAVGMFELHVDNLTEGLVRDFEAYMEQAFRDALLTESVTGQMRPVPIRADVVRKGEIARYDDIRLYVDGHPGPFGVMNCVCRQAKDVTGGTCRHGELRETCLMIGANATAMKELGHSRTVSKEEFLSFLDRAREQGLVLQPENTQTPNYICCCCSDCCEILVNVRKIPRPAEVLSSGFGARVAAELCAGCGRCIAICPMEAVSLAADSTAKKRATVDQKRCIGCGLCAPTCKAGAIGLEASPSRAEPPAHSMAMYRQMMVERFGVAGTLGRAGRMLFGMKV